MSRPARGLVPGSRAGRAVGTGLLAALALVGCAGPVQVEEPDPDAAGRGTCEAVLAALPQQVLDSTSRPTRPGVLSRAWGDPPIILRCGVAAPPGLTASSDCLEVNGVGWFREDADGGTLFSTIGRAVVVEVGVPSDYASPVDVLVDLSGAVSGHDPVEQPCA